MGTSIQILSEHISLVASAHSWIEGLAIQQLHTTAAMPGMQQVAGMPDLHPGKGYPIGAACFSVGQLYPALVGSDIGCGMSMWQTGLACRKARPDKLAKALSNSLEAVEQPLDPSWQMLIQSEKSARGIFNDDFDSALGTIGSGNHFAEFQQVDTVLDEALFAASGLDPKQLQLLVHSGSRGYGQSILQQHVQQFGHQGLADNTPEQQDYLKRHDDALHWAELNRFLIARRFLAAVRSDGEPLLDVNHNLVTPFSHPHAQNPNGDNPPGKTQQGWLHRKGATPADQPLVVIPGSRGDYSWLVAPVNDANPAALRSLAHGAGRKWKRSDCKGRLAHKYSLADLRRTALGSQVICENKELLYEEAPQAYKDSRRVIDDMLEAGLIQLVARLKPVLTFKTQGGHC